MTGLWREVASFQAIMARPRVGRDRHWQRSSGESCDYSGEVTPVRLGLAARADRRMTTPWTRRSRNERNFVASPLQCPFASHVPSKRRTCNKTDPGSRLGLKCGPSIALDRGRFTYLQDSSSADERARSRAASFTARRIARTLTAMSAIAFEEWCHQADGP